jgi:dihydrolipoamide dehydrogenase
MKNYDIVVLGSGPGGYVAAIKGAQMGKKVAIIEKESLGGVCLNWGCIPTKTLLKNAKVYKYVKHALDYGVVVDGKVSVDWTKMLDRKNKVVKQLTGGVAGLMKKNGVDVYMGEGQVLSKSQIKVGAETLETKALIIATGASPVVPPIPGLKEGLESGFVKTSKEMLDTKDMPKKLIIIGGGVIGVEFATIFSALQSEVTIIEKMDGILPMMDEDIRSAYTKALVKDGIQVLTSAEVKSLSKESVTYLKEGKEVTLQADQVLLSIGMKPNSQGLDVLKLEMDRASIKTNDQLQTNVPGVYAIGDVNGKYMLAHVASTEALVAVENICGQEATMDYRHIPSAVYGSPEIAMIGLTEKEAKEKGLSFKTSTFPLVANGRSLAENDATGFVKLIFDTEYGELLGGHILAYNASELLGELGMVMKLEGTAEDIAHTIHAHPTLSEIILEAAHGYVDKPIHM